MGTGLEIALFTAAGVGAASSLYAADQQRGAIRAQNRASIARERLQQQRANAQAARERQKQLRQARIARAQVVSTGQESGGGTSSGVSGALAGIQGATGSNLQFLNRNQSISNQISNLNISSGRRIARFQTRANFGNTIASLTSSATDIFGSPFELRQDRLTRASNVA